jgi:Na+/H+-dicarboxylate symporter
MRWEACVPLNLAFLDHRRHPGALTVVTIGALGLGLLIGIAAFRTQHPALLGLGSALEPVGQVWTNGLRMIVLPLIVAHLVVALAGPSRSLKVGAMAGWSFGFFLALLILAACYTLLVAPPLVRAFAVDTDALTSLKASVAVDADDAAAAGEALRLKDWLIGLVPANLVGAAARGDILPVIVGTLLFAAAMRAVPGKHRELLVGVFRAISEVTRVLASWLIGLMPIAVLALTIGLTARSGPIVASGIGYFIVLSSVLLILFTLLLYPITVLGTATPLRRLARALAPAQAVAVGTRSSLASLPALLESAEARLGLPASTASFVLPLSVSVFKLNRTISSPLKLLFLAHLFGIPLAPQTVVVFVLAVTVLSFGSPGIPSGGSMVTLPFYLAAGLPLEGVVLLTAVDAVPDIFKTVLNVTADMSVAALVTRVVAEPTLAPEPVAAPIPAAAPASLD